MTMGAVSFLGVGSSKRFSSKDVDSTRNSLKMFRTYTSMDSAKVIEGVVGWNGAYKRRQLYRWPRWLGRPR